MQITDVFFQQIHGPLAGRYLVERQIGRGATATVYLARDLKHDRPVAVKVLRPELSAALGGDRFLLEIRVAAGLQHPHILPLYDSGDAGGTLYYVMPFVEGESLRDRLNREPQLPLEDALRIAREVADALAYAHEADIVHRDIKPENILLSDGHAVVADFGIARAINRAGGEGFTDAGVAIGTPIYMSPEQASGERHIDGRTDIYSLGCVLYEMLAGRPPFTGPTTLAVLARRFSEPPAKLRTLRPEVPAEIETAVERAIADAPLDRFRTASDFEIAVGGQPSVLPARGARLRVVTAGLITAIVAIAIVLLLFRLRDSQPLDESLFVVLPFEHRMGAAPSLLNGNQCEILLHDALARWNDVRLVPEVRVNDARARLAGATVTLDDALSIARELGAANLAWGEVSQVRDSVLVRAYMYDVRNPRKPPRERTVRLGSDLTRAGPLFESLADSLLLGSATSLNSLAAAMNTSSLAAWRLYDAGRESVRRWDLDSAARLFRTSIGRDPAFPDAHLWLAQTQAWRGSDSLRGAQASAAQAMALGSRMSVVDREHAAALAALAEERYQDACERYRRLTSTDSLNSASWFGLAECNARDNSLVRTTAGPRFRGSVAVALEAYTRALEMTPSAHLAFSGPDFTRLQRLFYTDYTAYRPGRLPGSDTVYAAAPQLIGDTVTFIPAPFQDFMMGRSGASETRHAAAIAHTRAMLLRITRRWLEVFPASAHAHASRAAALEAVGDIGGTASAGASALAQVVVARSLSRDPAQRFTLAVDEIRLRVKLGEFAIARRLADSVLMAEQPSVTNAWRLASLAALTGHPDRAARTLPVAAPTYEALSADGIPVPAQRRLSETALALLAYASFGAPVDSLDALVRRLESQVRTWVSPGQRTAALEALLDTPLHLAYPELGYVKIGSGTRPNYLRTIQRLVANGDTVGVRREFAFIAARRREHRPGDVTLEAIYHESVLLLAIGDTTAATRQLAEALDALEAQTSRMLTQPPQAAALVRAMMLRAVIAQRAGKREEATQWATAVIDLWGGADSSLQQGVAEMRRIAQP